MCIVACVFFIQTRGGPAVLLPGTVVLHKASSAVVQTVQGYAPLFGGFEQKNTREKQRKPFSLSPWLGFYRIDCCHLKNKKEASCLCPSFAAYVPQKGRLCQNPQQNKRDQS